MSLRYLELWFHKMEHWHQTIKRFAMREILSFFLSLRSVMQQMLLNESTILGILVFSSHRSPSTFCLNVCSNFSPLPSSKYVPNVLIECYQKPEHYFGIQCLGLKRGWEWKGKIKINENYLSLFPPLLCLNWLLPTSWLAHNFMSKSSIWPSKRRRSIIQLTLNLLLKRNTLIFIHVLKRCLI